MSAPEDPIEPLIWIADAIALSTYDLTAAEVGGKVLLVLTDESRPGSVTLCVVIPIT